MKLSTNPNFENTIKALEFSCLSLDRISSTFFNLNSAETNDEIQKIAQKKVSNLIMFILIFLLDFFTNCCLYQSNYNFLEDVASALIQLVHKTPESTTEDF